MSLPGIFDLGEQELTPDPLVDDIASPLDADSAQPPMSLPGIFDLGEQELTTLPPGYAFLHYPSSVLEQTQDLITNNPMRNMVPSALFNPEDEKGSTSPDSTSAE